MVAPAPALDGFALPGDRRLGCLLVHGFTATPDEMRPLAEALAAERFPVRAVRLAGHGTTIDDLAGTGWQDWFASVEAGLATLRRETARVALAGMSLGALLALHLAAARPAEVDALVLCGTPVRPGRAGLLPYLMRFPPLGRRFAVIHKRDGLPDIADPAVRAASRSYPAMPLAAVLEVLRLQAIVRVEVGRVTQPTLLLHGRHDHSVPIANLAWLRARIGARRLETHVLERSWHVVTLDYDRAEVARRTADFLAGVEAELTASAART